MSKFCACVDGDLWKSFLHHFGVKLLTRSGVTYGSTANDGQVDGTGTGTRELRDEIGTPLDGVAAG